MTGLRRRTLLASALALPLLAAGRHPGASQGPRVVIVGGGFAGATAARHLARWAPQVRITLVTGSDTYYSCPFSNLVVVGQRSLGSLEVSRRGLRGEPFAVLPVAAHSFDPERRRLQLANGRSLDYDRLILAPGIDMHFDAIEGHHADAVDTFPHAWQAGAGTATLARRLQAVRDGGLVVLSVPPGPYRCPPGPYERASLMAWWLARHRPRAKLLILDSNSHFTKEALFKAHWRDAHADRIEWIGRDDDGVLRRVDTKRGSLHTDFEAWQPDLACVIPPQRAAAIARHAGLDAGRGWCEVRPQNFASVVHPDVHVIGDAAVANPMPKSAFAAASQARLCAAALAAEFSGRAAPTALLSNTCYSLLTPDAAIAVTGSYQAGSRGIETIPGSSGSSPADAPWELRQAEARHARGWFAAARAEAFGETRIEPDAVVADHD